MDGQELEQAAVARTASQQRQLGVDGLAHVRLKSVPVEGIAAAAKGLAVTVA